MTPWGHGKVLRVYTRRLDALCVEFLSFEVLDTLCVEFLSLWRRNVTAKELIRCEICEISRVNSSWRKERNKGKGRRMRIKLRDERGKYYVNTCAEMM